MASNGLRVDGSVTVSNGITVAGSSSIGSLTVRSLGLFAEKGKPLTDYIQTYERMNMISRDDNRWKSCDHAWDIGPVGRSEHRWRSYSQSELAIYNWRIDGRRRYERC